MSNKKTKIPLSHVIKQNCKAVRLLYTWYPRFIVLLYVAAVVKAIVPYIGIWFSARIITELAGTRDMQRLTILILQALSVAAIIALINGFITRYKNAEVETTWYKERTGFSEKMLSMDFVRIDNTDTMSLLSTIKQNNNAQGRGLFRVIIGAESLITAIATIIGGIGLTISLFTSPISAENKELIFLNSPVMVIIIFAFMIATAYISGKLSNKEGMFRALHSSDHRFSNRLFSFFGFRTCKKENAMDIRLYEQEPIIQAALLKKDAFHWKGLFGRYAQRQGGLLRMGSAAISMLFSGLLYLYVCLKAWGGAFGVGEVAQYIAAITALSGGVSLFVAQIGDLYHNTPFVDMVLEFLELPNDMYKGSLSVEKRMDGNYEVEFRDVSFKYPGSDVYALRHVSLKFNIGSRLAVVGENGSGKTTFIKLLCRLYDPTEGQILLNGIPIDEYDYDEYMDIFSVVFQDFMLFALPLGENVAGAVHYEPAKVMDCLEKAGFGERLADMPEGLNTYLYKEFNSDGVDVSGGEAQKIALARALYKGSPFIILDEPTAALDPIAEADIYTRFNEIVGGHTTIYISHRLSSCKFCDHIVVFDHGSIVQYGSHNSLVAEDGGKYQALWNAQAQYYQKQED